MLVAAVPSGSVRTALGRAGAIAGASVRIVVCASKGLEPETGDTMADVMAASLPGAQAVVLSGPSFAQEIAAGLPAALVAASNDPEAAARDVQAAFGDERLRIYTSDDVAGVCIGGALKNVIAIAVGCCDGFRLGDNARAALITRGLAEMGRLAERLGGHPLTLAGLAGLGDLVLTCTGELSRNRQVGLALARGESLADGAGPPRVTSPRAWAPPRRPARSPSGSASTCRSRGRWPPCSHERKSPRDVVNDLLARDTGRERT